MSSEKQKKERPLVYADLEMPGPVLNAADATPEELEHRRRIEEHHKRALEHRARVVGEQQQMRLARNGLPSN